MKARVTDNARCIADEMPICLCAINAETRCKWLKIRDVPANSTDPENDQTLIRMFVCYAVYSATG